MNTSPSKPHFFKPLSPGFENGLKIPIYFYKYVLGPGERCVGEALLKKNGREWRVRVKNGHFVGDRWRRFSEENKLEAGGFVIFQHLGKMVFEALVFDGITQCKRDEAANSKGVLLEKEIPREIQTSTKPNCQEKGKRVEAIDISESEFEAESESEYNDLPDFISEFESDSEYDGRPDFTSRVRTMKNIKIEGNSFTSTITRSNTGSSRCLNVPLRFAQSNGLMGKGKMILMNKKGRKWQVRLRSDYCHLSIGAGWSGFIQENRLKEGDEFRFEIVENGKVPVARLIV